MARNLIPKLRSPLVWNKKQIPSQSEIVYPSGFKTFYLGNKTPLWVDVQNLNNYAKIVSENPVVYAVLSIGASFLSNGRANIKDLKTGEIITRDNIYSDDYRNNKILQKAFWLFEKPNPLQSRREFLMTWLFNKQTFGNSFVYGSKPVGMNFNIDTVTGLWNIWTQWMSVVLKSQYFEATQIDEIIDHWTFGYERSIEFRADQILHSKEVNINLKRREDIIFGMSRLKPLQRPITNIMLGYESQNVIMQNRGSRMVITKKEANEMQSIEPLTDTEKEELQDEFNDYGFLEGQKQAIISRHPVDVHILDQDIRKLGLFESIASDAIMVATGYNVPEILVKLYLHGATYENQSASVKRMYDGTTIPEFRDFLNDLNDWLKLRDFGYEYVADFSHVPELQEDLQKKATANRQTSLYYKDQFLAGACTYNEWRQAVGQSQENWGDVRIFELDFRQMSIIMGTPTMTDEERNNSNNGNQQNQNGQNQ